MRVEIDGIGALENTVVDEPEGFVVEQEEGDRHDALAAVDRVILAMTIETVTAVNYLPTPAEAP